MSALEKRIATVRAGAPVGNMCRGAARS